MTIKNSISYSQTSAKLIIEGLPDLSLGQTAGKIGIISSWKLNLLGTNQLEGKLEHLHALINVLLPYARYCISGVKRPFGEEKDFISIKPDQYNHLLTLRSSREGVLPLVLKLDDSQLSDLVICLDTLVNDSNVSVDWSLQPYRPLSRKEKILGKSLLSTISIPLFGTILVFSSSLIFLNMQFSQLKNEVPVIDIPTDSLRNSEY